MSSEVVPTLRRLLRDLARVDRSKITYATASRNAIGVFIPLAFGAATGHIVPALAASIGALNAAFSDRPGPYELRAGRMLAVCLLGSLSALIGGATGSIGWLTVILVALWGFGGGLLVLYGPAPEQIGVTGIILLVVYGGFGLSPHDAALQALLLLLGGLFQTVLSVVAWPLRQFGPERAALSAVFRQLAGYIREPTDSTAPPPATDAITTARTTLTGLGSAHSAGAETFRVLLDEGERLRLELLALDRWRRDLREDGGDASLVQQLDDVWEAANELLDRLANAVARGNAVEDAAELLGRLETRAEAIRQSVRGPVLVEVAGHVDALLGQLRACVEVVNEGNLEGADGVQRPRTVHLIALRLRDSIATLRANLTLRSASFRHALRLAATLAVATAGAHQLGLGHAYWVPLTIAIVLKPDFTSTFSRGLLRIAGTMIGLGVATLLVHWVGGSVAGRVILIGVLMFIIRSMGPANFGLSAIAVTALVVVLISFAGSSPESTIVYRGIDTLIGGVLALIAYAVWPTWERIRTPAALADMLDAYRRYFDTVMIGYLDREHLDRLELDDARLEARLARSNAEASVDRMRAEPSGTGEDLALAEGILASSHRFVHSAMALEAGLYMPPELARPEELGRFVHDVDLTLQELASIVRQPSRATTHLPDLRADQTELAEAADRTGKAIATVTGETERITNSLNTMMGIIHRRGAHPAPPATRGRAGVA